MITLKSPFGTLFLSNKYSIAKIRNNGTSIGITPVIAIGTTDLHSSAQLDLSHTTDRSVAIVRETIHEEIDIASSPFLTLLPHLHGKTLSQVTDAARIAFTTALREKNVPVYEYEIDTSSAWDVGYGMQTKMLEVAYLARLFGVNAFDQPNVEDYKKIM